MSIVSVHGPHTWGQPFLAESEYLLINLLGGSRVEIKAKLRDDLVGDDPYTWDFGEGPPFRDGYEVAHTFGAPGVKTVTVQIDTTEGVVTDSITFTIPDGDGIPQEQEQEEEQDEAA